MADETNGRQGHSATGATYRVRGLTCSRCVGTALDELRALPGVERIGVRLVPFGVSLVTIEPLDSATAEQVRAGLRRVGFRVVARRRRKGHHGSHSTALLASQA
jgi:copper chaperone CopZ